MRTRLVGAVPGLLAFAALGYIFQHDFLQQPWFYIGLGMTISAVFVEPFFARPQDAIVNGTAAVGAFVAVQRTPIQGLWWVFLGFALFVATTGLFATIASESGSTKWRAFRLSSRFGRALVVGTSALLLVVLTEAAAGGHRIQFLALAVGALVVSTAVDWGQILRRAVQQVETATAVAAIGPRMLLVAGPSHDLSVGDLVEVGPANSPILASVVARMPHGTGLMYELALQSEWTRVCASFPAEIEMSSRGDDPSLVGVIAEGTTDRRIEFEPFSRLSIGTPVRLDAGGHSLLYQITALELVNTSWAGARAVVARARARLVGWPEETRIKGGAFLPTAHELIHDAHDISGDLAAGYYEVGRIKATAIRVGLRIDAERQGHIAILGMSGMGKTAAAQRLSNALGATSPVIVLDTTGEYARRLGFAPWHQGDFATTGAFVYEPAGDPPAKAAEFIKECMSAGHAEYRRGDTPLGRVVLLEEAHGFIPEWNFAQRHQQDKVSESSRMIMQARKFGLTFVIVSQRTAVVTKSALSQCENYIILKTLDQTSLEYLETLIGPELRDALPRLERFEALCVGPGFNSDEPVIVSLTPP